MKLLFCVLLFGFVKGNVPAQDTLLLYSTTKDIRLLNTTRNSNNKITTTVLIRNFTEGAAIDYHYAQKKICWVEHGKESIHCAKYDVGLGNKDRLELPINKDKVDVISTHVPAGVGLACDWFTNKVYWADSETKRIEVATMEGLHRKVLFWTDIDHPRAIALAPMKGLMFWTDWGETPKIERAGMNGDPSTRSVIISTNICWPNGLTIDFESEKIYWFDAKLNFLEVITYNGENRTKILTNKFEYPFSLSMYKSTLFWTDWKTWSIHFYDLNTGKSDELYHHTEAVPVAMHVYDKTRQPLVRHPCATNNGGCSHLCLLSPISPGFSCGCPIGIKMVNNMTCEENPENLLVLARRTNICLVYLDSPEYTYKVLPLTDVVYTIAVDYDPVEGFIYWSDSDVTKIQKSRLDGSDQQDVITTEIQQPDGIAIDWVSRNLYWTDAGTDHVEVCGLSSKFRKVVIFGNLEDPRAVAVAPTLGWLFWSDWNKKDSKIERANLDGTERRVLIRDLGWPNGITLDLERQKMYWCDAKDDRIEYSDMDGSDRRILINDHVPHAFGFTFMDDFLYWTDWQKRTIERANKDSGSDRKIIVDKIANVMGLKAIKLRNVTERNGCSYNNGGCSQLCFYRHGGSTVCACEILYELAEDRKTCIQPDNFLLYTSETKIGMVGIEHEGNEQTLPISKIKHARTIDYDLNSLRIYWSDSSARTIMRAFFNGSDPQKIVELGLESPVGIAIDWLGLNIYWTDPLADRIEVSRLVGTSRRTLLWEGKVEKPHSIVLDPPNGYMYWSEWGTSKCIKKAAMDGSNPRKLTTTKGYASDLTLDHEKRRIYWTDSHSHEVISSDLDGNDERVVFKREWMKPVGLTLFGDFIYFNDYSTGDVIRIDKSDGGNLYKMYTLTSNVTDLILFHKTQSGSNPCSVSNGGCSHLCLALPPEIPEEPVKYTCACPTHYNLVDNECTPPKQFMIYSQRNLTVRLLPNTAGCLEAVLPIKNLNKIKAIDFDPVHNFLYWIEGSKGQASIKRAEANGGHVTSVIIQSAGVKPFDLVVDSIGRLLFWTCETQNVVNVTRLDNNIPFGVVVKVDKEKPRLLAIHQNKRLLFYTDVGPSRQLVRTRLDGSHRLVITKDADIAAIAVDPENDWIVWAQGQSIYTSNIEGENKHVLVNESHHKIIQLTVLSGWLYWIDREFSLQRVELLSGNYTSPLSLQATHIVDIISVTTPNQNHSCIQLQQKKCSHLCILNGTNPQCACPVGNVLKNDRKTCSALVSCGPQQFTCGATPAETKDCIPLAWKCDQQKDCPDGYDELDCPECQPNQFKCRDGTCINQANVCDGTANCVDKSDEENCCKDGFQCPNTHVCLSSDYVCDKTEHCADGADEDRIMCAATKIAANNNGIMIQIIVIVPIIFIVLGLGFYCLIKKFRSSDETNDQSEDPLSPMQPKPYNLKNQKIRKGIPDVVRMSMIKNSDSSSYDRNNITGASSSTNGSLLRCYPREPLNPPPSPATTPASTRGSSPSSRYRPYRHYRTINQPPPPTPCSTDVCDESDYSYPNRGRYDGGGFFPPPPTPRSHCHSESCPPSPSSRSSTYFSPLPPPPSPVASPPRGYDS